MNAVLSVIRSEPIRTLLYPILIVVVGALVAKGVLSDFSADTIVAIVAAVFGVPAAEIARKNVWTAPTLEAKLAGSSERE
ncbi:hypothetical protein [Nocardia sp. NPDC057440]|uniref:phage holin n=1 Tax=Nocardia sp. NPDC057440 TaxID=3346134 RepID=UPI003672BB6D